jgi:acetyl esterase/lipase
VAKLPRLSPAAEHRVVKAVCGLPPRLQRLLFGAPVTIEGQRLAPDIQALLWLDRLVYEDGLSEGQSVEQTRADRRLEAKVVSPRTPIPMARVEQVEVEGAAGQIGGRLYVPFRADQEPPPLLVYYHGGGWVIGDLDTHDNPCRFLAAHSGAAVLAIDYRLAPEHPFPAAAEDAGAAYRWALANAEALDADPRRVGVGGDSAGANLSAVASLQAREEGWPLPAIQLLIYPVTETATELASRHVFGDGFILTRRDMDFFEEHYLPPGTDRNDPRVSILQADDLTGLPPAYVAVAGFDPLRDEGEAFAQRLREAGVQVALRRHPGLIHTFANLTAVSRSSRQAMLEAAGALRLGLSVAGSAARAAK